MKAPWTGIGLALEGMSMAPMKVRKGACQQIVIRDPDVTKLPIPKTWPEDGGRYITLPLVVTADPEQEFTTWACTGARSSDLRS